MTDPFMARPAVFAARMGGMAREYHERCKKLGRQPDMALLGPIVAVFNQLRTTEQNST